MAFDGAGHPLHVSFLLRRLKTLPHKRRIPEDIAAFSGGEEVVPVES
jgi:hypothetical protein